MLLYIETRLRKYSGAIGPDALNLINAADALITLVRVMQYGGWVLTDAELREMYVQIHRHHALLEHIEDFHYIPKHHQLFHMVDRAKRQGNPWFYHNFRDESLNKVLKAACKHCHQLCFEPAILHRMAWALNSQQT